MNCYLRISTLILAIGIALIFSSCERINCIEGNGKAGSELRVVDPFDILSSEGSFDVVIIQDTLTEVVVEAEENLLPYISTRTDDSKLVIKVRDQRCIKNNQPVKITVRSPSVKEVNLEGSGKIKCDSLALSNLEMNLLGSGDIEAMLDSINYLDAGILGSGNIYLNGFCTESELQIGGSGNIKAEHLEQETVFVNISGSGNVHLWVTKFLDVKISGSGNVYYTGNPTVNVTVTGTGSVIHNK